MERRKTVAGAFRNTAKVLELVFVYGPVGLAIAALTLGAVTVPRLAKAKPEFAAQTGLPCGKCHVAQAGGGKLKPFGEAFKANGYKVPKN
jgi:hypothetical protein